MHLGTDSIGFKKDAWIAQPQMTMAIKRDQTYETSSRCQFVLGKHSLAHLALQVRLGTVSFVAFAWQLWLCKLSFGNLGIAIFALQN